ncbi:hypothetical protein PMAYCL1PPCAC_04300, partial [Pristionchus mayeri]
RIAGMESSAFDELLKLGGELQVDYPYMIDEDDQMMPFDGAIDSDSLSLLVSDLDAPFSTASSYSGMASQSSSSSPAASSHSSSANRFPYQEMLADSSPFALESPPPMHNDPMMMSMGGGGGEMMAGAPNGYYEDYASPSGTYSSSDDSGHHSPTNPPVDQPLYDLEAGWHDYGGYSQQQQHHHLQRRSSSEDSEFAAPAAPAARRVLRLQPQQHASPHAADFPPTHIAAPVVQQTRQSQQPAKVIYSPPLHQQNHQPRPATSRVAPPAKVVLKRPHQPQQHTVRVVHPPAAMTAAAAAPTVSYHPVVVQQQTTTRSIPKSATVLYARTAPCLQLVSQNGTTALLAPIKMEPREEINEEEDQEYFRKQEDRKQKNRAAAQQSRLRRRCELDELRTRVTELTEVNRELEEENGRLKRRVKELESSHAPWAPPRKRVAVAGAAATCLMVFVMMFAFQATPIDRSFSPLSLPIPVSRQISETAVHSRVVRDTSAEVAPKSRALLAIEDYEEGEGTKESDELDAYAERLARSRNETMQAGKEKEGCGEKGTKRYPNQTETIRLNSELNAWVESHDLVEWESGLQGGRRMFTLSGLGKRRREEKREAVNGTVSPFDASHSRVNLANGTMTERGGAQRKKLPKKKSPRGEAKREAAKERAMRDRAWKHLDMVSPGLREHGPENNPDWSEQERLNHRRLVGGVGEKERRESYDRLAAAVQQRTDTLYVVAMRDYLLLPAIERNATSRPRVSIILPAVINGTMTTANNQVMLMRLDLDVVGTGLLHLAEGLLPVFHNLSIY